MAPILQAVNAVPLHISLRRRETLLVRGSGRVCCEAGEVWLTESGSTGDSILVAGEGWPLRPGVEIVLSTLAGAQLSVCSRPGAAA